jgi:DNA repair protein RecN (Recombination protein N)
MIESLHIKNYALIDVVDIDFSQGLNIITGETGAGKSIMLGALSLLLGERAESRMVRDKSAKSVIEACFSVAGHTSLKRYCADNDIEWDDERCILRREIAPAGRSRAFINDSPVTVASLREVAMQLVDLHSQHQNLLLATPAYQLRIIDSLAGNADRLAEFDKRYSAFKVAVARYRRLRKEIDTAKDDEEYTRFQLSQLQELKLQPDEQEELEHERDVLSNMTEIKLHLAEITSTLADGTPDILSMMSRVIDAASSLSGTVDEADQLTERLENVKIELKDIADTFEDYDESLSADGNRLETVEERLNEIYAMQRRHHVDSVTELIAIRDSLAEKLDNIINSDDKLAHLEQEAKKAQAHAMAYAKEISAARKAEASHFATILKEKALPLGMKNLTCDIRVTQGEMTSTGIDNVEFLFAFNKNQTPMPVRDTASGGEISRLMLSIKAIVASKMMLPSIIFDEVDTGVSGDVANRMGLMMKEIADNIQVIAITHLPQVAAKGNAHYKVYKEDDEHSTLTRVKRLNDAQRIDELALMVSGSAVDDAARAAAISLLNQ